jgi:predicted membrane protein
MSQVQFGAGFVANAKSTVVYGRELTAEEQSTINAEKISLINNGAIFTQMNESSDGVTSVVSYWADMAQGQEYISVIEGFTPSVATATIVAI